MRPTSNRPACPSRLRLRKALIGKKVGDTISVPAPGGDRTYEILSVKFG